jgi:hypothetical protein
MYCRRHAELVEEHGEDAVRAGTYPRRRNPRVDTPLAVEATPTVETMATTNGTAISPAEIRPRLAQVTAESVAEIQQALLDAALGATREHWATFTCPDCGKKHRAQVAVPDVRARVGAIEVLLREALGRPAQAEEVARQELPANANAVARMSWDEIQHLAAVLLADEIESVLKLGGREAVVERLASLSDEHRQVLREAFDVVAA